MSKFIIEFCMELNALTTMDLQFVPAFRSDREIMLLREEKEFRRLKMEVCRSKNWSLPEEDKRYKWTLSYLYLGTWKKQSTGLAAKLLYPIENEIKREDLEQGRRTLGKERAFKLRREVMQLLGVEKETLRVMTNQSHHQTVAYTPPGHLRAIIFAAMDNFSVRRLEHNGLKKAVPVGEIKKLRPLVKKILKMEQQVIKLFEEK